MKSFLFISCTVVVIGVGLGYVVLRSKTVIDTPIFNEQVDILPRAIPPVPVAIPDNATSTNSVGEVVTPILSAELVQTLVNGSVDPLGSEDNFIVFENEVFRIVFTRYASYFQVRMKTQLMPDLHAELANVLAELIQVTPEQLCYYNVDVFASEDIDTHFEQDWGLPACPGPQKPFDLSSVDSPID